MKNLKKIALLLSVITVFAISCGGSQQALNSTFDIIEDGQTSVPDNPPIPVDPDTGEPELKPEDKRKEFPSMWLDRSSIDTLVYGSGQNYNILIRSAADSSIDDFLKRAKIEYQYTVLERTDGTKSSEEILKHIYAKKGSFAHNRQHFVYLVYSMADALGSSGQSAKIRVRFFIQEPQEELNNSNQFKPGTKDLIVTVKRR